MDTRREHGQAIVEFAVIFPIFALFLFIAFDGAIVMGRYGEVNHAAKEGVRFAATGASQSQVADRVRARAQGILDSVPTGCSGPEYICIQYADGPPPNSQGVGEVGSTVRVEIKYRYDLFTPLGGGSIAGLDITGGLDHFDVNACAIGRLEKPRPGAPDSGNDEC